MKKIRVSSDALNLTHVEIDALWRAEATRRADQIDRGVVEMFESDVVAAEVRELLR